MGHKRRLKKRIRKPPKEPRVSPKSTAVEKFSSRLDGFGRDRAAALGIFVVALILRLLNLLEMQDNSPFYDMPTTDSDFFHTLALQFAGGDWLGSEIYYYNPLYPHFLGAMYTLFGPSFTLIKTVQAILGSFSCVFIYFIVNRLMGRKAALVAGLIAAAYGPLIFLDELLLAESPNHFFITATVLLLLRAAAHPTLARLAGAGAVLGLGFLTRPSVLPFAALLWLLVAMRGESRRLLITRLAVFVTVATLVILPVTLRNYVVGDDFVLVSSHTGYNFHLGNNLESNGYLIMPKSAPRTATDHPTDQRDYFTKVAEEDLGRKIKPSEMNRYWTKKGLTFIAENPGRWMDLMGQKFVRLFNEFEFSDNQSYYFSKQFSFVLRLPLFGFGFICPLGLLGMVLLARSWRKLSLLYLVFIGNSLSLLAFFTGARYRMIIVPFLIIFAAYALVWMFEKLKARDFPPLLKAAVPLALFGFLAVQPIPNTSKDPHFIDYYNLGNKHLAKKKYDDAIDAYRKSIEINPGYLSSQNNLASTYSQAAMWKEAKAQWETVLRLAERKRSKLHIMRAGESLKKLERIKSR